MAGGYPFRAARADGTTFDVVSESMLSSRMQTFEERLVREGTPVSIDGSSYVDASTSSAVATTGALRMVGHLTYVESITISASQAHQGLVGIAGVAGIAGGSAFPQWRKLYVLGAGQSLTFPVRRVFRPYEVSLTGFQMAMTRYLGPAVSTDKMATAISLNASLITDDFHYSAQKTVLFAGDSIGAGTGATKTADAYAFRVRDLLQARGYDCRLVLKAIGGTTTSDHETLRGAGYHDIAECHLGIYALGMNDGLQSVAVATSLANAQAFWSWYNRRYPGTPLVITSPSPALNDAAEARLAALRTAARDWVAAVASPLLGFISLADAFDRTAAASYYNADGIHPTPASHGAVATKWITGWDGLHMGMR